MPLVCVACQCGSSDSLIRTRLERYGYRDFLAIPITKGKEKSLSKLNTLPRCDEVEMLKNHIKNASKFAVVVGYKDSACKWTDLANGKAIKNNVDLELIIRYFA